MKREGSPLGSRFSFCLGGLPHALRKVIRVDMVPPKDVLKEGGTQIPPNCPLLPYHFFKARLSLLPWSSGQADMQVTLTVPQLLYCESTDSPRPLPPQLWDQICECSWDAS